MKKLLISAILVFLPLTSIADESGIFTIKGVGISATSESMFIHVNETIENTSCTKTKAFRLLKKDSAVFKEIMTLATTAKATGSKVTIAYDEVNCVYDSSVISYLYLR